MDDSDPRLMPPEVQRAYSQPVNLLRLLRSDAYSSMDRDHVRDELLRRLIERHGEVWFPLMRKGRSQSLSSRVRGFRDQSKAIEFLLDVPDYGGSREALPLLAQVMQPVWARWWSSQIWRVWADIANWYDVSMIVLGDRQFAWIGAQYARTVIDLAQPQDRAMCLRSIDAAEAWSRVPSEENRRAMNVARFEARDVAEMYDDNDDRWSSVPFAVTTPRVDYVAYTVGMAQVLAGVAKDDSAAYAGLCELTKRLITPTLVTSAARSSGSSAARSKALPAAMGALLGAGAMQLANRL